MGPGVMAAGGTGVPAGICLFIRTVSRMAASPRSFIGINLLAILNASCRSAIASGEAGLFAGFSMPKTFRPGGFPGNLR